jgi:hypothetical protein
MKQTAVECFAKQVLNARQLGFISNQKFDELLEKAKQMEKERIISFAEWYSGMEKEKVERAYQRYLNETFNKQTK